VAGGGYPAGNKGTLLLRWGILFARWGILFVRWGILFVRWGILFVRWGTRRGRWDFFWCPIFFSFFCSSFSFFRLFFPTLSSRHSFLLFHIVCSNIDGSPFLPRPPLHAKLHSVVFFGPSAAEFDRLIRRSIKYFHI
jgi:hypothetical protein